jgi:hypothetical protein
MTGNEGSEGGTGGLLDSRTRTPDATAVPQDGELVVKEFSLGGSVPRTEPSAQPRNVQDVYVRLENTIYGPLSSEELAAMLASGQFTGYESASSDLQHWTPLLYHPRMNLTGYADPDATHAILHGKSSLPAASRAGGRVRLEDFADEPPPPSVPLAAIMLKPRKASRRLKDGTELPVFAELEDGPTPPDREPVVHPFDDRADTGPFFHSPSDEELNAALARPRNHQEEPAWPERLEDLFDPEESQTVVDLEQTPLPPEPLEEGPTTEVMQAQARAAQGGVTTSQALLISVAFTALVLAVYFLVLRNP